MLWTGCVAQWCPPAAAEPILGMESLEVAPDDATPQDKTAADAFNLFQLGNYDGALRLLREAVEKNPDLPPAQTIMSQLFLRINKLEEAREALQQAMAEAPDDPGASLVLANVHLRKRELDEAESMLRKTEELLAVFDKNAKRKELMQLGCLGNWAALAEAREDWAGAERLYTSLLEAYPKNLAALTRIAYCLYQQDRLDDALEQLEKIQQIAPATVAPEAVIAQFFERSGDREKADQWIAKAVEAAPKNLATRLMASQRALAAKQLGEARRHAIAATRIDRKSLQAIMLQGLIATLEKNYMTAELIYEAVLQQAPNQLRIRNNLALVLIEQNDEAKGRRALELVEANTKQDPNTPEWASTHGYVLYRLGRLEDAEKAFRAAAPIVGTDVDAAYVLACLAAERGRKDEARRLLETGLKSKNMAMFRQEAETLLEKLNQDAPDE